MVDDPDRVEKILTAAGEATSQQCPDPADHLPSTIFESWQNKKETL